MFTSEEIERIKNYLNEEKLRKLEIVRDKSKELGITGIIDISNRKNKRFMIKKPNGDIIHFGVWPFNKFGTYIDHKDTDIRNSWRARHSKILLYNKPAYLNVNSPEYYSWNLLW